MPFSKNVKYFLNLVFQENCQFLSVYNLSVLMSSLSFQTPEQFVSETGIKFTEKRMMKLTSLDDLKNVGVLLDCSVLYV